MGSREASSPLPWTLTLAVIRTARMGLGQEDGESGSGGGSRRPGGNSGEVAEARIAP